MTLFQHFKEATMAPLYDAREKAAEARRKAVARLDMQGVREAEERLHAATHAALAAELALRGRDAR